MLRPTRLVFKEHGMGYQNFWADLGTRKEDT